MSTRRIHTLLALACLSGLAACRSSPDAAADHVVWLVRHSQFDEALAEAKSLERKHPTDERIQRLALDAEVASILDKGRRAVFKGRPVEGLVHFEYALELDPDNRVVSDWILKTCLQLAESHLDQATTANSAGELEEAEDQYEACLGLLPPPAGRLERIERMRTEAELGLSRVLLTQNYREGLSKSYYQDGIRDFREFLLARSERDFNAALKYDEDHLPAEQRLEDVQLVLAAERMARARSLEEAEHFFAAGKEYRLVLLLDPENEEAQAGYDRMDLEARAKQTLAEAEMSVFRGKLERAEDLLGQAAGLTQGQDSEMGHLVAKIEDERLLRMYQKARNLERDYRYPEAVTVYTELLEASEFYEDAIARMETIKEFIALADEYYTAALDAETDEEAADYLARIPVFWPEYRDVEARLAAIRGEAEER